MELNINVLSDFVKNAEILFHKAKDSVPQVMRGSGLVKEIPFPSNSGNTREFTEIDLEEYAARKKESDQAARAKVQQGYSKIGRLERVALDIGISYEMRSWGKHLEIQSRLTSLGKLVPNRMDLDLTHRITFGTATSYTNLDGESVDVSVGDTKALFATDHDLKGSSTTFRNRLANNPQLSRGSLEAMEKMRVENTYNQFGEKMTMRDDILWVANDPNTINTAKELLRSTSNPTQNNPGVINAVQNKYRLVVLPRLATDAAGANDTTKAKYWGIASSDFSTLYLGVQEDGRLKTPPAEGKSNEEFSTDDWNFGVRGSYMVVCVAAAWIGMSSGDGSA